MTKIAARFLILIGLLYKVTLGFWSKIQYVTEKKTWFEARNYCRNHYTDLYSGFFKGQAEWLLVHGDPNVGGWIGLYRDANNTWKWSEGNNAFNLSAHHYNGNEGTTCVALTQNKWRGMDCGKKRRFYCSDAKSVLVKENKTWEEAHEHCRSKNKNLASPLTDANLNVALRICSDSQTEYVWIGLRYLAGRWLTMKTDQKSQPKGVRVMPECPAWGHNCGAISTTEQTWVNWDCAAKLNFIC